MLLTVNPIENYGQKYIIQYAQFETLWIDTSVYELPHLTAKFDTLAKWNLTYDDGQSLFVQTDDSPHERKFYHLNKKTGMIDEFISHNMSKNDLYFHDYSENITYQIKHFFDLKYFIKDTIPNYNWTLYNDKKMIGSYLCKRASTRDPIGGLFFEVWYTVNIPISCGPISLQGLPGLILEVNRNGTPFYTVMNITKVPDSEDVIIEQPEPNEESISLSDYHKIRLGIPFENKNTRPPSLKNKDQNR